MKSNKLTALILIAVYIVAGSACAWMQSHQAQIKSAIGISATGLLVASRTYQTLGKPGLPQEDAALYDGLTSGYAQLLSQIGQRANPSVIDTGVPAVNDALKANITPGAIVTQGDAITVATAASKVAPPNTPAP